jgi:N-acetylneuraminic acid mutarotase
MLSRRDTESAREGAFRETSGNESRFDTFIASTSKTTITMKIKSISQSAFFNVRILAAALFCLGAVSVALFGMGAVTTVFAQAAPRDCGWKHGPNTPSAGVRLVGVFFQDNIKFYAMGGRASDSVGSDFTNPFQYDPVTHTWTTKSATYPDNQVSNMACAILNDGANAIFCLGGNAAGGTTATARVFRYDPVTDTITSLSSADNWPGDANGTTLPGGFAVVNNKLYILGGFNINISSTNQIWEFDPNGSVGAKWTQKTNTPEGVMYAPTCAINGIIYLAGASDFSGGTVVDTTNSFSFNPATNTIGAIAPIPRATGETRALNFNGLMCVMGGGRVSPNPSNEVDIYDPGSNTWTTGTPVPSFFTPRRNFPTDTNGTTGIVLADGYAIDNVTPLPFTEQFHICSGRAGLGKQFSSPPASPASN